MDHDKIDPERSREPRPFNDDRGYSGQEYRAADEEALGRDLPAGDVPPSGTAPTASPQPDNVGDLPDDNGRRARVDAATGEVRGSGAGAGGGQPGEDFDGDSATGDGPVVTGVGSRDGDR